MAVIYGTDDKPVEIGPGRGDLQYSSSPLDLIGLGGVGLVDGRVVSCARIFEEQPWAAIAVMRLLTWSVRVPLKVYRRTGDDSRERLRPKDHKLARSIAEPWPRAGAIQLVMAYLGSLLVHGNGNVEVEDGPQKMRFTPLDWRGLRPIMVRGQIRGWRHVEEGEEEILTADEVTHVRWWSPFGAVGISPLTQLGTTIKIEEAAQRHQVSMLRNSARPPSAIATSPEFLGLDKDVREALFKNLRSDITDLYSGPDNSGKPAILPPGLTWQQVGHTAVEAQLIEQRLRTREEIAAIYMIPPPAVGQLDRSTFNNIQELLRVAYTDGLGPPLVLIEAALNDQVVRQLLRDEDVYVEFDFAGILRGDRLREIEAIRAAVSSALMTPNEGRSTLNYPKSAEDGADALWLPRNNLQRLGAPGQDDDAEDETP